MATYAFAAPILQGKTEDLKKYINEMTGPRMNEFNRACQKIGINTEQMWIQRNPNGGDMLIIRWETENVQKIFDESMQSNDSLLKWFREKVIFECLGVKPGDKVPSLNERILNFTLQPLEERKHVEAAKK